MTTDFDPIPRRQILSYRARGPELESIFRLLCREGPLPFASLSTMFAGTEAPGQPRKDDLLLDALDFLRAVELVGRWRNEDQSPMYQVLDGVDPATPFPILLLHQLHRMSDNRDAFRIVHDLAVRQDAFLVTKDDLLKGLEGMYPGEYAWNTEKMRSWQWLASYLGLIRSLDPRQADLMICPTPKLLLSALRQSVISGQVAEQRHRKRSRILISAWLEYMEDNLFRCFTERRDVHDGLARALLSMDAAGQIELDMMSDAPGAPLLRGRRVSYVNFRLSEQE